MGRAGIGTTCPWCASHMIVQGSPPDTLHVCTGGKKNVSVNVQAVSNALQPSEQSSTASATAIGQSNQTPSDSSGVRSERSASELHMYTTIYNFTCTY